MMPNHSFKLTCYGACLRRPVSLHANATELKTASWWCNLAAELPRLPIAVIADGQSCCSSTATLDRNPTPNTRS